MADKIEIEITCAASTGGGREYPLLNVPVGAPLASGEPAAAVAAASLALSPGMTAAEGFRAIAWNCLEHLLANFRIVVSTGDPEALHQCRVAIRRLRAAFTLFGAVVRDDPSADLKTRLKNTANALGPARDLHVLMARIADAARSRRQDASELLDHLGAMRGEATADAQAALADDAFQNLMLELAGWLESGDWLANESTAGLPLERCAAEALSKWRRKVRHSGKRLSKRTDAELHRLRIQVKKLRYGTEFFSPLFREDAGRRRAFNRSLRKLQDRLGILHDHAVAATNREPLFAGLEPQKAERLAGQMTGLLERGGPSRKRLLKSVEKHLDRIDEAPAWWKSARDRRSRKR